MRRKVAPVEPHDGALAMLMGGLMRRPKKDVASACTSHVRALGIRVTQKLVKGARNGDRLARNVTHLPSLLYVID